MGSRASAASLPDHVIAAMKPEDRKSLGVQTNSEASAKAQVRDERRLQADCERWLTLNGYRRRTPESIATMDRDCVGWFIHLSDTKHNPILCDLLILRRDGTYVEIELKAKSGRLSREQAALSSYQWAIVCRSLRDFIEQMQRK